MASLSPQIISFNICKTFLECAWVSLLSGFLYFLHLPRPHTLPTTLESPVHLPSPGVSLLER